MSITDLFRLDGAVAIITGASSGLGVAFATALAEAGAAVAIAGRRVGHLEQTREAILARGGEALVVSADVADPAQCDALVAKALERFGKVSILVNNAGIGSGGPALRESPSDFRRVIDVNLNGCFW
ncbi:MAG: hypothetical protein QOH87_4123, partial [Trebonia sp.]|nr:hypothetical protein [Trebonia sp.]